MIRLIAVFILTVNFCFGQNSSFKYPVIPQKGKFPEEFIPKNWRIRDSISFDFNEDYRIDKAMVIETRKPFKFLDTVCGSNQDYHPKMLLVLLNPSDSMYILLSKSKKIFGTCNWGVQGADPFEKVKISDSLICLSFLTGGTERDWQDYYFRFENGDFYLSRIESTTYWAGHLETGIYSDKIDLVNLKRESFVTYPKNIVKDRKIRTLKKAPLIKLSEISDGYYYDKYLDK